MIVSIKKKTLTISALAVCAVIAIGIFLGTWTEDVGAEPKLSKTIVLDAGHGGIDGGVTGIKTGVKESDINIAIVKNLKKFLVKKGYTVVLTRQNSDGLYGFETSNRKLKDLNERKRIINAAKPDLMISIHCNSYPTQNVRGAQVFYAPSSEPGMATAKAMQETLKNTLPSSDREAKKGDYFILQCSPYPSILVECGFLSNPEDEKLLVEASYQEKVAYAIFNGILKITLATPPTA